MVDHDTMLELKFKTYKLHLQCQSYVDLVFEFPLYREKIIRVKKLEKENNCEETHNKENGEIYRYENPC